MICIHFVYLFLVLVYGNFLRSNFSNFNSMEKSNKTEYEAGFTEVLRGSAKS
jgi:hypothetical protein